VFDAAGEGDKAAVAAADEVFCYLHSCAFTFQL